LKEISFIIIIIMKEF